MKHTPTPWSLAHKTDGTPVITKITGNTLQVVACCDLHKSVDLRNANRIIQCVNALEGIEDPIKMRETWDVVKELELDAFQNLKEHHEGLKDKLKALFFEFCPYTPQQQELIDKLNRVIDEH